MMNNIVCPKGCTFLVITCNDLLAVTASAIQLLIVLNTISCVHQNSNFEYKKIDKKLAVIAMAARYPYNPPGLIDSRGQKGVSII